jgi:hypothetical protein
MLQLRGLLQEQLYSRGHQWAQEECQEGQGRDQQRLKREQALGTNDTSVPSDTIPGRELRHFNVISLNLVSVLRRHNSRTYTVESCSFYCGVA